MRTLLKIWLLVMLILLPHAAADDFDQLFFENVPGDFLETPELTRVRRQTTDISGGDFATFEMTLVGSLTQAQRTTGEQANTELLNELASQVQTELETQVPGTSFLVTVDSSVDLAAGGRRKKRQVSSGTIGIRITGTIIFTTSDLGQTLLDLSRALVRMDWGPGLTVFSGQTNEVTLDVQSPHISEETKDLGPAVCRLCQSYENCTQMANGTWYCKFEDSRFYPFGEDQNDNKLDKSVGQTSARLAVRAEIPYGSTLYSTIWLSLYGTISFGRNEFNSFASQNLPIRRFNVIAPYWTHFIPSALGEVYFHLYMKTTFNTAQEQAIFELANSDVREYWFKDFDATVVIVVTWDRVLSYYGTDTERASFQAVIISDGSDTYLSYIYGHGAMQLVPRSGHWISVGWGTGTHAVLDSQANYFQFDTVSGDTGKPGLWFFKIGEAPNAAAKCLRWFNDNVRELPQIRLINAFAWPRGCPCSQRLAFVMPWWIRSRQQPNCYDQWPRRGNIWGKRCCYRGNALDLSIPNAGSFQRVSPYSGFYQAHLQLDVEPKKWCCEQSNLCSLYYFLRPRSGCVPRFPRIAFLWGDPHMVTLDSKSYTFNNLGEFELLNVNGQTEQNITIDFQSQGRTCRAVASSGNLTDASVWCGFALMTSAGSQVQITSLKGQTSTYLEIFANTRDYTAQFRDDATFDERNQDLFLKKRDNGALEIATQDGVSFIVSVSSQDVMEFSVELESELANLTSGLMGNFNGDPDDDFMFPNGTVMSPDATDREVYEYVKTWAVTDQTSIFTYDEGKSASDFADPSFVPLFLDEVDNETISQAAAVCGGTENVACIFDFVATNNQELAQRSTDAIEEFDANVQQESFTAPTVTGPETVNVTVGENVTITYDVTHDNNRAFNVSFETENVNQYNIANNQNGTVEVVYTPQANIELIESPTLVVVDEENLSTLATLGIVQCSGCSNHGQCDFENVREVISPYISIASCNCDRAYSGIDCENDKDGCEGLPCPVLSNCTDVPADEEMISNVAFNCSECPSGYRPDSGSCADINECSDSSTCPPEATCENSIGSYICNCNYGYRKDVAGDCQDVDECVELSHNCAQTCVNTVGAYTCDCLPGFRLDDLGFNCTKEVVDPCANIQSNCSYGCNVVDGAAQCFCERGFQLHSDGRTCLDIDECLLGLCAQTCTNTVGSYRCGCYPGFKQGDDHDCIMCEENKYGENCAFQCECRGRASGCDNVRGCQCLDGWTGTTCETDVNECETVSNLCPSGQVCNNTNGGYVCECPIGYSINGTDCVDIDECADALVSQCPQECTNNPGSFFCYCEQGYRYNNQNNTCDDINECEAATSQCDHDCLNAQGSYSCRCKIGYVLNDDRRTCRQDVNNPCAGSSLVCDQGCTVENEQPTCFCLKGYALDLDNITCIDVDECAGTNLCSDTCNNTEGGYNCSCPIGKSLGSDQRTCDVCDAYHWGENCATQCECNPVGTERCDPVSGCKCGTGWTGTKCYEDIKECENATSPCPEFSSCTETPGSYICSCNTGFQLLANNTCSDIDECALNVCDQNCTNTIGSFQCSCNSGFSLLDDKCIDIDECSSSDTNECQQTCRNLIGNYQCGCLPGYTLNLIDRQNCTDIDECANTLTHTCSNYELCSNTIGSFNCSCKAGYDDSDFCAAAQGPTISILSLTIRLNLPSASDQILENTTQAFRVMEVDISRKLLEEGNAALNGTVLSVVVVQFTRGSFIADTRITVAEAPGSEELANSAAVLFPALRTADLSSVSPGATVLGVSVDGYSVTNTSAPCEIFGIVHQCRPGYACNDTDGTARCYMLPTTIAPPADDDNTDLYIGLGVGIGSFLLIAVGIAILVYVYLRRKRNAQKDDRSSRSSDHGSMPPGISRRWNPGFQMPYSPASFHDSGSSDGGSTTSGAGPSKRPKMLGGDKSFTDRFEPLWMTKGAGTSEFVSPREGQETHRDRPARPNTNSNFSWEYMFSILEPHMPLEIQRPQVSQQQRPGTGSGSPGAAEA